MSNVLPQGWEENKLSFLVDIIGGGTPKTYIEEYWNGDIPWLSVKDFNNDNRKVYKTEKTITELGLNKSSTRLLQKDELIISARGTVGELAQIPFPMAFNQSCYGLRGKKDKLDNTFLYYGLKNILSDIRNNTHGSVFSTITKQTFDTLSIKFPSDINEQKSIADILSAFDDKIELNNQMNQTLEDMATTLFKEWFENFNFPNEQGKPYKDNDGEMKSSELGEIPIDCEICFIGDYVEILGGGTPSTKNESYWIGGDINWFSPTDITKSNTMFYSKSAKKVNINGLRNSSAKEFPPYSLMLTSRATVGEIGINTEIATTNQGFITLIPNEVFYLKYLYFWLHSRLDEIHSLASGSTFKEINKRDFKKLKILKLNKKILDLFEEKVNSIFEKIENNQKENDSLKNLRDELLPKLMSGEKRV